MGMAKKPISISWLPKPEALNYPAAASYLDLIYAGEIVTKLIKKLRRAPMVEFKSKDIFRASGLSLLGTSNSHVEKNIKKIQSGKSLSPLLLVRDTKNGKVLIADGYHRMCSVYHFDEDATIPCKII